jgi:hypothetical protein
MIPAPTLLPIVCISGFGSLLLSDPTYHHTLPTHPQTTSSFPHFDAAGLRTGWREASRCDRKEYS